MTSAILLFNIFLPCGISTRGRRLCDETQLLYSYNMWVYNRFILPARGRYNVLLNVMENSYFFILIDFGELETGSDVCKNNFAKETK